MTTFSDVQEVGREAWVEARRARLAATEISLLVLILGAVAVAVTFPFPPVKYGIAALLGVVAISQTFRRPAIGLAMLALATPAVDLLPPALFGVPGMNAETLVLFAAFLIWSRTTRVSGKDQVGPPLGRIVAAYALMMLASCVNSWLTWHTSAYDLFASAKNHLTYMIFLPVGFHVLRTKRDQWLLVATCSIALLLNFAQAIHGSFLALLSGSLERHRAVAIIAIQANAFGSAIAMFLPFLVLFGLNKIHNRAAQIWFLVCAGAGGFALLLTLSRGSWLGAVAGLAVVAVLRDRKLLLVLLIGAASYTAWVPQAAIDRVEVTTDVDSQDMDDDQIADNSTQMRIEQYKSLSAMMAPRPVFGWGYRSFPQVFEQYGTLHRSKGAHSSYCQLGTEEGVIGLVMLFTVLVGMAWAGWSAARITTDPLHRWLGVAIVGGTVAMAVCMMSGARFEPQKMFAFFWILIGIAQRETVLERLRRRGAAREAQSIAIATTGNRAQEAGS